MKGLVVVVGGGGGDGVMGGERLGCLVVRFGQRPSNRPRGHQTHTRTHASTHREMTQKNPP